MQSYTTLPNDVKFSVGSQFSSSCNGNCVESIEYVYHNVPIPGGGFVTGLVFHPSVPGILYCRTDIGGIYRYDFANNRWVSLVDHATDHGVWETFPLSIALDKQNPQFVYTMVGDNITNKIAFSDDMGAHWTYFDVPNRDDKGNTVRIHGNASGRATGERLVVDPNDSDTIYMATMQDGLWKTTDRCRTWTRLNVSYSGRKPESCFTFVEIDPTSGSDGAASNIIIVATNGQEGSPDGNIRGQSVYISSDAGETFKPLIGEPSPVLTGSTDHPGYVGQRAAFSGEYLFVTYSAYNIGWSNWLSCGCDIGLCYDGAVMRYRLNKEGEVTQSLDVTPKILPGRSEKWDTCGRRIGCGMGGICADPQIPGTLICSTITFKPDAIFHSTDYGVTWKPILSGLEIGKIEFNVPYMRPENNGNRSLIHWLSDLKINPFDSGMALFNTGTGLFMTRDLTDADSARNVTWVSSCDGVEETVHLNVYSPPAGDVHVIDILGDLGGFAFTDLDKPAENTFADSNHERWVTIMNADYPDKNPLLLIATPRGNWTGETKGGIILSRNQGKDWKQLSNPRGLSNEIDEAVDDLQRANVTSGWAAISADGKAIVWAIGSEIKASLLVFTNDFGRSWGKSAVYDFDGKLIGDEPIKVMSDRANSSIFYGFGKNQGGARFYVSNDKGVSFHQVSTPSEFPDVTLSGIDSEMPYEIRVESDKEGAILLALQQYGLWRILYDAETDSFTGSRISAEGDIIKGIGQGKPLDGDNVKVLYCSGTIGGIYGFWCSHDDGATWKRINDDNHQFGDIRSITGDPRITGRVYIGTGSRGLIYGDPVKNV